MQASLIHPGTSDVCEPVELFGKLVSRRVQTPEPVRMVSMRNTRAQQMMFPVVAGPARDRSFPTFKEAPDRVEAAPVSRQRIVDLPHRDTEPGIGPDSGTRCAWMPGPSSTGSFGCGRARRQPAPGEDPKALVIG